MLIECQPGRHTASIYGHCHQTLNVCRIDNSVRECQHLLTVNWVYEEFGRRFKKARGNLFPGRCKPSGLVSPERPSQTSKRVGSASRSTWLIASQEPSERVFLRCYRNPRPTVARNVIPEKEMKRWSQALSDGDTEAWIKRVIRTGTTTLKDDHGPIRRQKRRHWSCCASSRFRRLPLPIEEIEESSKRHYCTNHSEGKR